MQRVSLAGFAAALFLSVTHPPAAEPAGPETIFPILSQAFADEDRNLIESLLSPSFYCAIRPDSRTVRRSGCINYLWWKWLPPGRHYTLTVNDHSPCLEDGRGWVMNRVSVTIRCDTDGTTRDLCGTVSIEPNARSDWPPFVFSGWVVERMVETVAPVGGE